MQKHWMSKKREGMFFRYLREKAGLFLLLAIFVLIFAAVFSLYQLPAEAVGYAALWCVIVGIAALFFRFQEIFEKTSEAERDEGIAGRLWDVLP